MEEMEKAETVYFCTNCFKKYAITESNEEVVSKHFKPSIYIAAIAILMNFLKNLRLCLLK